jgi:hypothetical protein
MNDGTFEYIRNSKNHRDFCKNAFVSMDKGDSVAFQSEFQKKVQ